jgi:hypothetical protein
VNKFEGATTGGGAGVVKSVPCKGKLKLLLDGAIVGDAVGDQSVVFASEAGL